MKTTTLALALALSLVACKKDAAKTDPPKTDPVVTGGGSGDSTPPPTTPPPTTPPPTTPPPAGGSVDMTSPTKVTEAVFAAAATGKTDQLAGLCDPKGESDGDTKDLCGITPTSEKFAEFKEYFAKGKATGETITGDAAEVKIMFGPAGDKEETMKLVQRDGKWYLSSF